MQRTWNRSRAVGVLVFSAGLIIGLPQSGVAQEEKVKPFELEEVVVTSTKTEKLLIDVPVRTEVITSADIKAKGAVNLYEALEGMPGIRVEQQCSYCNFSVVRMQGLESGHVQVLIDGQPTYSGLAGVYGLQQVPTANIERIEVVKGAGSALYGSSAIAGVINIITKRPTEEPVVRVTSSLGSHDSNDYSVAASSRTERMDVMVTAQKNTGGEIDEDDDGNTDRVKTDNISTGVRVNWYKVFGDDQVTLTGRTLNEQRQGGELSTWENPFAAGAEHIRTARHEAGIGYKKTFAQGGELAANLGYCHHDRNATNDSFIGDYEGIHGEVPPVDEMEPYLAEEDLYVVDLSYAHSLLGKHRLLGGVQYSRNRLEETGKYVSVDEEDPNYGDPYRAESEKSADEVGVYLQGEFALMDSLELVVGARFDSHSSEDDFAGSGKRAPVERRTLEYDERGFNPRVAVMYKASPALTIRASAGTGFRVPYGFSEDLHLCSGSPRVNKPADLDPEKSVSLNLGADYIAERYMLSANLFRTDLADKIGFADASEASARMGYTYEWENIGDAYTQGIELGFRVLLMRDLDLEANLAYTDAQYEEERADWVDAHQGKYAAASKYIPRVPGITGGVKLGYAPGDWNAVLNASYTGRMYIDYCEEEEVTAPHSKIKHTDAFVVVNPRLSRDFSEEGITAFVGAKNLFDYVQDEKHPDDAAFMYAPYTGRILYAGVELVF